MGSINDGRLNERAEEWEAEHGAELHRLCAALGMSFDETVDWVDSQNPYRQSKLAAATVTGPGLFDEADDDEAGYDRC